MRCIDDFSRSSVNANVQTCESPKPHTIDVFAAMCVHLMEQFSGNDKWVGRTFDLIGAYRQCAVKPSSPKYSHFLVQQSAVVWIQDACPTFWVNQICTLLFEDFAQPLVYIGQGVPGLGYELF